MTFNKKTMIEMVCNSVCFALKDAPKVPTRELIKKFVESQIYQTKLLHPETEDFELDVLLIVERVNRIVVATTSKHSLIDIKADSQHEEWMDRRRLDIENGVHWPAYKLFQSTKLSDGQIRELDWSTDRILSKIEDPLRVGKWQSRGLVIGDVQSGKTTNFIGVINKALDAGYRLVIVLSGLHNNLRSQTQQRFEEGVTGFNTKVEGSNDGAVCGVAKYAVDASKIQMNYLTVRDKDGDFRAPSNPGVMLQSKVFSVNKKNTSTLKNLIKFLKKQLPDDQKSFKDLPFLLIDDEADHASINTRKDDENPSVINNHIRTLLNLFDKHSYIGYTATPFANALINPDDEADLFPRNFIMCLGRNDNYIGPSHVFGVAEDDGNEERDGEPTGINPRFIDAKVDWFRNLDDEPFTLDWKNFIPEKHDKNLQIDALPRSVTDAINSFIISVTVRNLRGDQFQHKTMLIHVTRFKAVQNRIVKLVKDYVSEFYTQIVIKQYNDTGHRLTDDARMTFERDFKHIEFGWEEIAKKLPQSVSLIREHVYGINGDHHDVIDEDKYPEGLTSIRIGGEKLSRGLTLPGLMTSYFLRASRMYDTLMQMGRWFGYRDNFEDICRIYTTARLYNWFGHIALASEGLRDRITSMDAAELTPLEYRQQIQSHPGMMLVTALNKQRSSLEIDVSYNGELALITGFDLSVKGEAAQRENMNVIESLFERLLSENDMRREAENFIFSGISALEIINFISDFSHITHSGNWNKETLLKYIQGMNQRNELVDWTVVIFSNSRPTGGATSYSLANQNIMPLERRGLFAEDGNAFLEKRNMVSKGDEKFDIKAESEEDEKILRSNKRREIRGLRKATNGLLVIYLLDWEKFTGASSNKGKVIPSSAISFPVSKKPITTRYVVGQLDDVIEELNDEDA